MNLYLYLLNEVVQFQTVSFDPKYYPEITRCVKWYSKLFKKYGFHIRIIKGYDNPIILSEFTFNKTLPTVLIYGHYDVQPAAMEEGWKSDPFKINENILISSPNLQLYNKSGAFLYSLNDVFY